jgi:hypothetical protein
MELRVAWDETGRAIPRFLSHEELITVSTALESGRASALGVIPSDLQPRATSLYDALAHDSAQIRALHRASTPPKALPEAPAALLAWASAEELGDTAALNHLIDRQVGALAAMLEAFARKPKAHPLRADAERLQEVWFKDGRGFLLASHEGQWLAVESRLDLTLATPPATLAALQVEDTVVGLRLLNARFGWALGLLDQNTSHESALRAAQDRAALERHTASALQTLGQLVALAQLVWPSDREEDLRGRRLVVGSYLQTLVELAETRSRRARKADPA